MQGAGVVEFSNQRRHQRLPITLKGELRDGHGHVFAVTTVNISFGGALVNVDQGLPELAEGKRAELVLYIDGWHQEPHVDLVTEVVRTQPTASAVAVHFVAVDLEGYNHFKNLMLTRCPQPEELAAELEANPVFFPADTH